MLLVLGDLGSRGARLWSHPAPACAELVHIHRNRLLVLNADLGVSAQRFSYVCMRVSSDAARATVGLFHCGDRVLCGQVLNRLVDLVDLLFDLLLRIGDVLDDA